MAWLHTWAGLLVGWVLFFVFLTGTLSYVYPEIDRWMRPEQPRASAVLPSTDLLRLAEQRLRAHAPTDATYWFVILPSGRRPEFQVGWRPRLANGKEAAVVTREILDPRTGLRATIDARQTDGGGRLYAMHFLLHYVPRDVAIHVVGVCAMFMFVAILSGIVTHKQIFADFFTFRLGKGQRSWLDGHNLLAVSALPFHLMITWSGLIFFAFQYMPAGPRALYPEAAVREQAFAEGVGSVPVDRSGPLRAVAPLVELTPLLARTEAELGAGTVSGLLVFNPGRENAVIHLQGVAGVGRRGTLRSFSGVTGELLDLPPSMPGRFNAVMLGLHEAWFAGPALRALYVLAGFSGTAMIATGLLLWSVKRRTKLARNGRPHFGIVAVDILNVGTIVGLPIGIAAYFWANRLLPVGMDGRAAWEVHTMFFTWAFAYLVAIWRPLDRAWPELCWLAAVAYGLIPVLNALTTGRHVGASIAVGDWLFVGFDLSTLAAALFFACVARKTARRLRASGLRAPTGAAA